MRFFTMFGLVGLGGGFLYISPPLRASLADACGNGQHLLEVYQPYSYVGLGAATLVALVVYMYRCAQPH